MSLTSLASMGETGGITGSFTLSSSQEALTSWIGSCGTLTPPTSPGGRMRSWQKWTLIGGLTLLAVLFFLIGFIYLKRPAGQLPQFLGRIKHADYHRTKREMASFVVGAVFLLAALTAAFVTRGRGPRELPAEENAPQGTIA